MASFSKQEWERLRLVKDLVAGQDGQEAWYDVSETAKHLAPVLGWRPPGLEEFTDHDLDHSYRILRAIGTILPESFILNRNELLLLLYAALYHDLGMWTPKREVETALQDESFSDFFGPPVRVGPRQLFELI